MSRGNHAGNSTSEDQLGIRVTDNNNEILFKIKKSTPLDNVMQAFCGRQGKKVNVVRFLFEGQRVQPTDSPDSLGMVDGDSLSVHQEQVGGFYGQHL
ncbi:ubiquitin-related domain-containing protein [Truncatella angustata]|uniref:Ubiquitin-related domain-containing protein n=1 Tax=Truncatella angustata TaxID=152316 RepID=A0A9P8ZWF1_9PEZI|nr:ubiquitin-related domain-containing protein [Truncatella angustata]KAH6653625.1 ubiquitin-related domain-containing protein [Truncatella angustata]